MSNAHHNFNEFNRKQKAKQLGLPEDTSWVGISEHIAFQYTHKLSQANTNIADHTTTRITEYGNLTPIAA